jgi:hypothetical protein
VIKHIHPNMTWAYKFVAAPFAAISLVVTFLVMLISEIRRVRRVLRSGDFPRPAAFHRTF